MGTMDTTDSLLYQLAHRISARGTPAWIVLAVVLGTCALLAAYAAADALSGTAAPVLMAPFRWTTG